jgi:hypothetical protein
LQDLFSAFVLLVIDLDKLFVHLCWVGLVEVYNLFSESHETLAGTMLLLGVDVVEVIHAVSEVETSVLEAAV